MRRETMGITRAAAILLAFLLSVGLILPSVAFAKEAAYTAMKQESSVSSEPSNDAILTEKGVSAISWSNHYCYPARHTAYLAIKASASQTGIFSDCRLRIWDGMGRPVALRSDADGSSRQSKTIWCDIYSETSVLLSEGTTYFYQFSVTYNGTVYESPLYSFTTCSAGERHLGIDVSNHNGQIDWETAAQYIDFAIIRCGYGSDIDSQDDRRWLYNVSECERLGIPYGVYLYSYAYTEDGARSEAAHTIRLLQGHTPTLPVYYDLENKSTVGTQTNAQIVRQAEIYCGLLSEAGYKAGVYANHNWWTTRLTGSSLSQSLKWLAAWNGTYAGLANSYGMWQFTDSGRVPGVSGQVDMDYCVDFQFSGSSPVVHIKIEADFVLPASVLTIESEAFAGCGFSAVQILYGTESIDALAFADCKKLRQVEIPASVTQIADNAFQGCTNVIIFGKPGSSAETYCATHDNCTFAAD